MGQGDRADRRHNLRAAHQANVGSRCRAAAHFEIHGVAGLAGGVLDSAARDDLHGDEYERAAAICKCRRAKKGDGSEDCEESNQQLPADGPATNLIRVKGSIEHQARKSRIRALARVSSNY